MMDASFPQWGHAALVAAFIIGLIWAGAGRFFLERVGAPHTLFRFVATFLCALVTLSFASLIWAYVSADFSLKNVFENANSHTPLFYRVTGVWGNHEGSMLLWVWLFSLYGCAFSWMGGNLSLEEVRARAKALWIHTLLFAMALGYSVFMSSPFEGIGAPVSQGLDLNPLLQDPALSIHPPLLYAGYLGLSLVFACVAAGHDSLLQSAKRWTLWAWCCLTLGIMLGSFWAYYELGWGGWWFWDPVENASLMPWLCATALLHLWHVRVPMMVRLLGVGAFSFCLLGLTLVRSGVLSTVHAFASDPQRGVYLGVMTACAAFWGGWQAVRGRPQEVTQDKDEGAFWAQENALKLQMLLFMTLLFTVVLATLYPLILEALTGNTLTVGTPYFVKTFVPVGFALLLLMGAAPFLKGQGADSLKEVRERLTRPALVSILMASMLLYAWHPFEVTTFLGMGLVFWIVVGSVVYILRARADAFKKAGMLVAHLGVGAMVFGMCMQTHGEKEHLVALKEGETTRFQGREVTLEDVSGYRTPTYMAEKARLRVAGQSRALTPEKRFYPGRAVLTSETALLPDGMSLYYAALGGLLPDDKWSVRLFYHPQVIWIWVGAMMMALGGGISLISLPRRGKKT